MKVAVKFPNESFHLRGLYVEVFTNEDGKDFIVYPDNFKEGAWKSYEAFPSFQEAMNWIMRGCK